MVEENRNNSKLNKILNFFMNEKIEFVELTFIEKHNNNYVALKPNLSSRIIIDELLPAMDLSLSKKFDGKEITVFDSEANSFNDIPVVELDMVETAKNIINTMSSPSHATIKKETMLKNAHCYIISIINKDGEKVHLFKKYSNPKVLTKSLLFRFSELGNFENIAEYVISIDDRIDAILHEDDIYIINQYHFENIFNYKDEYVKLRDEVISEINESVVSIFSEIESIEIFSEHCKDGRYIRQFNSIKKYKGVEILKQSINQLPQIIDDFDLIISLDDNGLIKYESKESLSDMLKLLSGKFVYTALNKKPTEAIGFRILK